VACQWITVSSPLWGSTQRGKGIVPFARAPEIWFAHAAMLLLGALQEADPKLRERIAAAAASP
jgi:hypothetical protein